MTDSPSKVTHWPHPEPTFIPVGACGADARGPEHALAYYEANVTCPECRRWMEERR